MKLIVVWHYQKHDTDFSEDYEDVEIFKEIARDNHLQHIPFKTFRDAYHDVDPNTWLEGFKCGFVGEVIIEHESVADREDWS